jgi:hypothetical protein
MSSGRKRALLAISLLVTVVLSTAGSAARPSPSCSSLATWSRLRNGTETSWAYAVTHPKPFTSVTGKSGAADGDLRRFVLASAALVGYVGFSASSFAVRQTSTLNCSRRPPSYTAFTSSTQPPVMLGTQSTRGTPLCDGLHKQNTVIIGSRTSRQALHEGLHMKRPDLGSAEWSRSAKRVRLRGQLLDAAADEFRTSPSRTALPRSRGIRAESPTPSGRRRRSSCTATSTTRTTLRRPAPTRSRVRWARTEARSRSTGSS